jgi:cobalt-zinc-cadmium efflux system protein
MALLSDASHNFSDVLSLIISHIANTLAKRKSTSKQTFGYKRAEILAAFINSFTLIIIAVILFIEAIKNLLSPPEINANIVIYLAGLSIILNGLSVLLIKKDAQHSMNIKSAYLHLFTDMLTSIAVLIGGFVIKYLNWFWFDSVLTITIAIYLIYNSLDIFKTSLTIFMEFTPQNIDINKIVEKINSIENIKNIHHMHIWQLTENEIMFEAHIDLVNDIKISKLDSIINEIETILNKFDIHHSNIQPEWNTSDNKEIINTKH